MELRQAVLFLSWLLLVHDLVLVKESWDGFQMHFQVFGDRLSRLHMMDSGMANVQACSI